MTRRRMPKRGPGGRFLNHAQRVKERERPAGQATPVRPPYENSYEKEGRNELDAQRGIRPVTPSGTRCDECGEDLVYAWMHVGRASYHIGRCMRCSPEPPVIVRE